MSFEERHESAGRHENAAALDVSIVIVTWNSERWIERCVRSIAAACEGLRYEVIIHDNASADATIELVEAATDASSSVVSYGRGAAATQILRADRNLGFAAATNRGIAVSQGRYVFLLNPDCDLERGAVTELFEFLEERPEAAAAAPLLIGHEGEHQREFQLRRLPTFRTLAAEVLMVDKLFPGNRATARHRYRDLDLSKPQPIEQPAAAALLIRRDVVERVGALDEQFAPAWFEDVDYCRRMAEQGCEVWVVPSALVRHFGGASLEHISLERFAEVWYGNMWRYARKWMRPGHAEALRWVIIAGMILRCSAALVGLRPNGIGRREAFRAYANVMRKASGRWGAS